MVQPDTGSTPFIGPLFHVVAAGSVGDPLQCEPLSPNGDGALRLAQCPAFRGHVDLF